MSKIITQKKMKITEEMKFRERVIKYAIKYNNNAEAARRYRTNRQQVQRWRSKYQGNIINLSNKSTRPKYHPNQHTKEELELIKTMYIRFGFEGLAQVYRKCRDKGYKRSFGSMCKQIKKFKKNETKNKRSYPKSKYKPLRATRPGEYVQIDVKFVPLECIKFRSNHARYYQITAIDLYSRKRVLMLVNEHSTYTTSKFLETLEKKFGFNIDLVQTDNGKEFCNQKDERKSLFEKTLEVLGIEHKRTRPYSPWQNGVVERSHKMDNKIFYSRRTFISEKELYKAFNRYATRTNNISRRILNFKTPNEVVEEYFRNAS